MAGLVVMFSQGLGVLMAGLVVMFLTTMVSHYFCTCVINLFIYFIYLCIPPVVRLGHARFTFGPPEYCRPSRAMRKTA